MAPGTKRSEATLGKVIGALNYLQENLPKAEIIKKTRFIQERELNSYFLWAAEKLKIIKMVSEDSSGILYEWIYNYASNETPSKLGSRVLDVIYDHMASLKRLNKAKKEQEERDEKRISQEQQQRQQNKPVVIPQTNFSPDNAMDVLYKDSVRKKADMLLQKANLQEELRLIDEEFSKIDALVKALEMNRPVAIVAPQEEEEEETQTVGSFRGNGF